MKSEKIDFYFHKLQQQREAFYHKLSINEIGAWVKPKPDKWSVGETLYHLVLMVRMFRRFSGLYIPVMTPVAHLRKNKAYQTEIHDIYKEYNQKKRKPMKAPFVIDPPAELENKRSIEEIKKMLEEETNQLISLTSHVDERIAGQIYYPDPIAHYPNLIQCIHLLAIHENHHYKLVEEYFDMGI
ncbi:hypothetical protein CIL05_14975 [Virgibacillus profundi]|uniref:DinB-like domain-containing protein n=1 Tax=Virgibacillus profundi TaxID=2024555 RepID=A0A2A2IB35_9BACI|nr:DinB family protein [Virgibacillus profundi]PAV28598.1 hypothetical protein CIL05_14975 [Virgibacillus profundi]PXY52766.1 DinB family protein [Virgibacillus profundi]